jgi:hypothetical protein
MKDYTWLAVFSVFTLVVGLLFTYGNGTRADTQSPPIQVFVTSTSTPVTAPIIIENPTRESAPPSITINVIIATSSFATTEPAPAQTSNEDSRTSRTYYVTNNTYTNDTETEEEEVDTVTLSIEGVYEATTTPIESGETVLELLTRLNGTDSDLSLVTEDYGDMGVLVTAMGGLVNGTDGKYWQYQVDGETPMIGADQYELADGKTVLWEFKGF